MSPFIILRFVPLNSYWLHETCLKYKLYISGEQRDGRKPLEGRRGRREDNIKIDVKLIFGRGDMVGFVFFRIGSSAGLLCSRQWIFLFHIFWLTVALLAAPEALCCIQFVVRCTFYWDERPIACVLCFVLVCVHRVFLKGITVLTVFKELRTAHIPLKKIQIKRSFTLQL
jgi:hypothetical protein